ncbi:hypothetical protein J1605_019445 [Eschrichtius robustus]|uniref:Uncharacterized protein n=1 Tax=Eschrichtius robustus TaxID=9764 RepID=A0AB34HMG8_ESCRO|nr:hypothetical protein J1605_019445 [Eschrichtius robustus]
MESEEEDEERPAEDSNDIDIPPGGGAPLASPTEALTPATASWRAKGLPVSLSSSQSWRTESPPESPAPESWQQVAVDPEEVESLDSNGAGEKSEGNSANSDLAHVEEEEVPEGAEAAAPALMAAGEPGPEGSAGQTARPTTSLSAELAEEEAGAAASEAAELEQEGVPPLEPPGEPPAAPPGGEQTARGRGGVGGLGAGPCPAATTKLVPRPRASPSRSAEGQPLPAAQVLCRVSAASQALPCPPRPRVPRGPVERARPMLPTVPLVKMLPLVFKRTRRKRPGVPARDRGASLRVGKLEGGLAGLSRLLPALLSVHSLEPTGPRRPAAPLLLGIAVRDLD